MESYSIISYPSHALPEAYKPMIFSKLLRSLRFGNDHFKKINADHYYETYHKFIENLMNKPDSITRLAVLTTDHDVVLGYCLSREDVLDYVHVHKDMRQKGIAKALIPKNITVISHITKDGIRFWQSKHPEWTFNPFA